MHCSDCGFEVQSGFAFCPRCGVKQPRLCPSCGHSCAPDFTFCPKCGVRLEVTPPVVDGVPSPPLAAGVSELKAAAEEGEAGEGPAGCREAAGEREWRKGIHWGRGEQGKRGLGGPKRGERPWGAG